MEPQSGFEVIGEGKYLRLVSKDTWEYVERLHVSGIVMVIAVTPENRLLLVEQDRPAVGHTVIQLPAGHVGDHPDLLGELFEIAAQRELLEETGYQAERMRLLTAGPSAAATASDVVTLYMAEGVQKVGDGGGVDDENLLCHTIPLEQVAGWVEERKAEGRMIDLRIYSALFFLSMQKSLSPANR